MHTHTLRQECLSIVRQAHFTQKKKEKENDLMGYLRPHAQLYTLIQHGHLQSQVTSYERHFKRELKTYSGILLLCKLSHTAVS